MRVRFGSEIVLYKYIHQLELNMHLDLDLSNLRSQLSTKSLLSNDMLAVRLTAPTGDTVSEAH